MFDFQVINVAIYIVFTVLLLCNYLQYRTETLQHDVVLNNDVIPVLSAAWECISQRAM